MGSSSSTARDLEEPLWGYRLPEDRARVRQVRRYTSRAGPDLDVTVDAYDYLIIFSRHCPGEEVRLAQVCRASDVRRPLSRVQRQEPVSCDAPWLPLSASVLESARVP